MNRRLVFWIAYASSGAAALVYEVAWTRLLTLTMGHTVAAASIVLASFMGGLAAGAWLAGGPLASVTRGRELRAYALLELFVAVAALALPLLLAASTPLLVWAYADASEPWRFAAARASLGALLLGLPAAAMGATFPLAATWASGSSADGRAGFRAGAIYAINTAGAALGALACGFWILPSAGLRGATAAGVALNVAAAAAAWLVAGAEGHAGTAAETLTAPGAGRRVPGSRTSRPPAPGPQMDPRPEFGARFAWAAAATSGFVALVYEVAWTRLIAMVVGPTTYAFATMLAAFIGGLAIGAAAGASLGRRATRPALWLGGLLVVSALAANGAAWYTAVRFPLLTIAAVADPPPYQALLLEQAFIITALLVPTAMTLGAVFPLALGMSSWAGATVGRYASRVYAANTLAAIAGALCGGFLLLPHIGLRLTFQATGIASVVAGLVFLLGGIDKAGARGNLAGLKRMTCAVLAVLAIWMLPVWDSTLLSSGAYLYASFLDPGDVDAVLRAGSLPYYKEGSAGTVTVREVAGTRLLAVDGKVDASNGTDMPAQRVLGLLPVLAHRAPEDVCVIGFGSGVTVAAALAPGQVRRLDVVEISPEVLEASRYFHRENKGARSAPGVRVILGDGRSHLALTTRRYDVVISEPSNPWMAGVAALFTREYLESARARLKPGGLFVQWAQTYSISRDDLRSIAGTFTSVFPDASIWLIGDTDMLLMGATESSMQEHLATLAEQAGGPAVPEALGLRAPAGEQAAFALLSLFSGGTREIERFAAGASIQTDARMTLEFSAPYQLYEQTSGINAATIQALGGSTSRPPVIQLAYDRATDTGWMARGQMARDANANELAYQAFLRAVSINSRNGEALSALTAVAGATHAGELQAWLERTVAAEPANAFAQSELAVWRASTGQLAEAAALGEAAYALAPGEPKIAEQLVSVLTALGDQARLQAFVEKLADTHPQPSERLYYRAFSLVTANRPEEAIRVITEVAAVDPRLARAQLLWGAACLSLGQTGCAQVAYETALRLDPKNLVPYLRLGELALRAGKAATAADYFAQALFISRRSELAREGLAKARQVLNGSP